MKPFPYHSSKDSFTLVELLVVIGILAILTAAVVIVLNPAELLKQSRDSKRTTDLASLNNAIKLLLTQSPDVNLGSASTVYISLVDSSSTCGSYSLPLLPSGWQYRCATSANYQKADGTGWVPVSFSSAGNVASLAALPIDPQNTIQNYYSYVAGGSWQIAAEFESEKYAAKSADDGGLDPASYEVGSNLSLAPFLNGLVGYWPFDEASGSIAYDQSGFGSNAAMYSSSTPAYLGTASGCKVGRCMHPDGIDDWARADNIDLSKTKAATVAFWRYIEGYTNDGKGIIEKTGNFNSYNTGFVVNPNDGGEGTSCGPTFFASLKGNAGYNIKCYARPAAGAWVHIAAVFDKSQPASDEVKLYLNGAFKKETSQAYSSDNSNFFGTEPIYFMARNGGSVYGGDPIDDFRIYNRALSAGEIKAIYDATQ